MFSESPLKLLSEKFCAICRSKSWPSSERCSLRVSNFSPFGCFDEQNWLKYFDNAMFFLEDVFLQYLDVSFHELQDRIEGDFFRRPFLDLEVKVFFFQGKVIEIPINNVVEESPPGP